MVIAIALLGLSLASNRSIFWFFYWDGPYYGRVVDAETGAPLEGAAVAGIWEFEHLYFKSIYTFANAQESTTDKDGRFELPLIFAFTFYPISILRKIELLVFIPGYDSFPPAIQRTIPKPEGIELISPDGMYWVGKWEDCEARQECLIELHKALNQEEENTVTFKNMDFNDVPIDQRGKLRNIITTVNHERQKFRAFAIPLSRKEL